jgi:hypothetical protein
MIQPRGRERGNISKIILTFHLRNLASRHIFQDTLEKLSKDVCIRLFGKALVTTEKPGNNQKCPPG